MTDDPEGPVHYQISVTGRQAAAFFLALLVALGAAFFFGMKTGHSAYRGSEPVSKIAAGPEPSVSGTTTAPGVLEGKRAVAPTPEMGEKKLGFDDGPPREAETPTPVPAGKTIEKKAPEAAPAEASPAEARPTPAPAAKKETAKKEARKEPAGPFFVQLLATKEPEAADTLVKKLKDAGGFRNPDVSPVPGKAGTYRVRVGPFADRASAERVVARLKKEKRSADPSIVKADKP